MTEMRFLPGLRKHLAKEGVIYTVRKYKMDTRQVHVRDVGDCLRKFLGEVFLKSELEVHVPRCGFATVDEWWCAIRRFVPVNSRMFLYEVSLEEREVC